MIKAPLQTSNAAPPYVGGFASGFPELVKLPFRNDDEPSTEPSCALRSKKPAHNSARDSFSRAEVGSENKSALSDGELGVRWKGELGRRRELLDAPGRDRPAFSRCSSVQLR